MIKHRYGPLLLASVLSMSACGSDGGTAPRPGSIRVTTTTTGADLDLDGYLVRVGAEDPRLLELNDTIPLNGMDAGTYTVTLEDVAVNCVADAGSQSATVSDGDVTEVPFHVTCTALPAATVDVTGNWEGTYEGRNHVDGFDRSGELFFDLVQSGDDVTGTTRSTWNMGANTSPNYSVTGRVSGNALELFYVGWTEPQINYQVRVTNRGAVSGSEMTGSTSEQMGAWTGTWTVTRQ